MKKKLKDVCIIEKGKQIDTKALDDSNSYRYINGGIKESGFYNDFNTSGETVLISEGGASCGYVNYVNEQFWCGCHCYRLTDINAFPKFLFYSLKASQNGIMELRTGAAMPNIKKESLKNFEISIIEDKEDQIKIAAHLDTIQSAIDNKKQQLALLDEAVKSEFVEMFGENPVESGKWKVERLEDACSSIVDCPHTTPKYEGELKNPAIRTSEIKKGYITWDSMRYVSDNEYEERTARLRPENGDIVYGREGTFGNAAILPKNYKFCLGQRVMLLRPDYSKCVSEYLLYTLISDFLYQQALDKNRLTTVAHVNVKDVKNFKIPIPPLELQTQFASFVQKIDKSKSLVKKQITDLQELLDSKMQEYFGE